jgi:hypothetical protein
MKKNKTAFIPFGRYILVSAPIEKIEKEKSGIILPPGYKKEEEKFAVVKYLACGPKADVSFGGYYVDLENAYLVVEKRMIEKIDVSETYVVLDQYVVGAYATTSSDE